MLDNDVIKKRIETEFSDLITPISIDTDNEYIERLPQALNAIINKIEPLINQEDVEILKDFYNKIQRVVKEYYFGNIENAHMLSDEIVSELKNSAIAVSKLNGCCVFSSPNDDCKEINLFRARLSNNILSYQPYEMLHIPFSKRSMVKSERFSIPGQPCLYLGNTSYCCWIEMGCPPEHEFNVSPVIIKFEPQVLNLCVTNHLIFRLLDILGASIDNNDFITLIKLFGLTIATSFRVNEDNRNFKSEYILSQLIMLSCKKNNIDGVVYYSKQMKNDLFATVSAINVALISKFNEDSDYSDYCENIEIDSSFNFQMFKQLLPSLKYKEYRLRIDNSIFINSIGDFDRQFPYRETQFYDFDKYLFANWDNKKNYLGGKVNGKDS